MDDINQAKIKNNFMIDNSEGDMDPDESLMINNEFYNDDFYDFKDAFLSGNNKMQAIMADGDNTKSNPNKKRNYEAYEEDDYGFNAQLDDEEEDDENNDFKTGPLAVHKSKHKAAEFNDDIHFDGDQINENNQRFFHSEFDEEQDDIMMMDTFFKRVDSLELVKPKKTKIINNYLIGELLGDGSYGKVKECLDMSSLTRRAVKIINLKMVARKIPRGVENVRKEINIMKRLNHKNIIKLYDTFEKGSLIHPSGSNPNNKLKKSNNNSNGTNLKQSPSSLDKNEPNNNENDLLATTAAMINLEKPPKIYIFMDYCMTSLEKLLKNAPEQRLCNWQANFYFKQLVDGLEYLHSLNIIHNDIKPGNLLITCDDSLKICDFSISADLKHFCEQDYLKSKKEEQQPARNDNENNCRNSLDEEEDDEINPNLLSNNYSSSKFPILQCTPMFQCPEMLDEDMDELLILKNATKIDIWSSGITLYQLTTGNLPFQGQTLHQIFESIKSNASSIKIPEHVDKNLAKLILGMLDKNPVTRWSIKQIRDSEWYKKKHPIVQEDVARLPQDVVNNEYSTFRMINYLEKYCESKQDPSTINHQPMVNATSDYYTADVDNTNLDSSRAHSQMSQPAYTNNNKVNSANGNGKYQNGAPLSNSLNPQQAKQFSQATKVKKNHCDLM